MKLPPTSTTGPSEVVRVVRYSELLLVLAGLAVVACGATTRVEDEVVDAGVVANDDGSPASGGRGDELITGVDEPEPGAGGAPGSQGGGAGVLPSLDIVGSGGAGGAEPSVPPSAPALAPPLAVAPDPVLSPVELPVDTAYPAPGILQDDRAPARDGAIATASIGCPYVTQLLRQGQRTTLGAGIQARLALQGPAGLPLDAEAHADCVELVRLDGMPMTATVKAASATNALTLLLVQPAASEEGNALLMDAALKLFMSRPNGERMALYRWGASTQQITGFTTYRDTFSDSLARLGTLDGAAVDAGVAVTAAADALEAVGDDAHAWVRSVVVLAPAVAGSELLAYQRNVNVLWAVDTTGVSGFHFVPVNAAAPADAIGDLSARLDTIRQAGFLTFGICGDGLLTPVVASVAGTDARAEFDLKDALPEEQAGSCDPGLVADFSHYDTKLVELAFDAEQRQLYDAAVDDRDDTVAFALTVRLSPEHGATPAVGNLRGGTSLAQCPPNRMNFSMDFEGGRERFFFPESSGSVGSDEFYLTAMCLDPMYVNQLTMDRLMASLNMFVSGVKLVEVRVDGDTQGVYLLMEQVKEALVRTQSGLMSVLRRRNAAADVKFPGVDDPVGQELALGAFDALRDDVEGLTGQERLSVLSPQLDLHRYMFFAAVQSAIFNADWADEPTFFATATLGPEGNSPYFQVNGWDPDDVLLGACAHDDVMADAFGMIGCAEHALEKAIFGADQRSTDVLDDEVYAMYVDALEVVLGHLTEELVAGFYDATVDEMSPFMANAEIVAVMDDWSASGDAPAAVAELVSERKAAFGERRDYLLEQLANYRASH